MEEEIPKFEFRYSDEEFKKKLPNNDLTLVASVKASRSEDRIFLDTKVLHTLSKSEAAAVIFSILENYLAAYKESEQEEVKSYILNAVNRLFDYEI